MRHCAAQFRIPMVVASYYHKQAFIRVKNRNAVLAFHVLRKPTGGDRQNGLCRAGIARNR